MIIVASQRSGAFELAQHLSNTRENDHVTVSKIDGFIADDLHGALQEAYAVSQATQCKQYLFSVSLNPPGDAVVEEEEFHIAAERVAEKLGLSDQPFALVIHEKNCRRHAHVVFSRIDVDCMKAINLPHFKNKLRDVSRDLFLDHGWELPEGLRTYGRGDPFNFSLSEWQQAQRIGVDPREMKQLFREAWEQSDDAKSLTNALVDKGLYLAKGDRRGHVAIDINGNIYALARWTGVKTKDVRARLGDASNLEPVADVTAWLRNRKSDQVKDYIQQAKDQYRTEMRPLLEERDAMITKQREERATVKASQERRWVAETKIRSDRLNKGLRGLFDRLTGAHRKIVKRNEHEALECLQRDKDQRHQLIEEQTLERKELQSRALVVKLNHKKDRALLARNIARYLKRPQVGLDRERRQRRQRKRSPGIDFSR